MSDTPIRLRDTREPMDYGQAVQVHRIESDMQHKAEQYLAEKSKEAAEKERAYRQALATEITTLRGSGVASTVARDLARGDAHVSKLQMERDIAEGLRDAAQQSIYRHTANRRDLLAFIEWSKRAAFLDLETPEEPRVRR